MKKFTYIIIVFIIFIFFAGINIFADNIDKAKIGQKIFAQAIENNEITISSNEDDDFKEIDEIIGNCEISDEEMSKVVGERLFEYLTSDNRDNPANSFSMSRQSLAQRQKDMKNLKEKLAQERRKEQKEMVKEVVWITINIVVDGTVYTVKTLSSGGILTIVGIISSSGAGIVQSYIIDKIYKIVLRRIDEHYK